MTTATKYTHSDQAKVNDFLDVVLESNKLKNDAAMARFVHLPPATISKLRHEHIHFSTDHIIAFHEATSIPTKNIKQAVGIVEIAG